MAGGLSVPSVWRVLPPTAEEMSMDVRVITLRYQDALQGFSEEALRKAISGREVLEAREHSSCTATCRICC